jgi:hypothetical protein
MCSLAACTIGTHTKVSVKTDLIGWELDTLGLKLGEKAEVVGDLVEAKFNTIREKVADQLDSVKRGKRENR